MDCKVQDVKPGKPFDSVYTKGKLLGAGSSGSVFLARNKTTGEECVIKVSYKSMCDEFRIGSLFDHPNLLRPIELWFDGIDCYLVMDLLSQVSMLDLEGVTMQEKVLFFVQLAKAVQHMHECGFLHCDIKPSNFAFGVSFGATRVLKLLDFGLAKPISDDANLLGTVAYFSPEALRENCSTTASDVWAVAMCILEIMMGLRTPYVFSLFPGQLNLRALGWRIGGLKELQIPASFRADETPFGRCLLEILETGLAIEPERRDLKKIIVLLEQLVALSAES
jgi:serine/threonine-protein kinase